MSKMTNQLQKTLSQMGRIAQSAITLGGRAKTAAADPPPAEPVEPRISTVPDGECVYAIGDVHGRFDLLKKLIVEIGDDAERLPDGTNFTLLFLGDYIDRGLQSCQVIDFLISDELENCETVFLKGNHEEALLRFLQNPDFGEEWAVYGGAETLYSYGLQPPPPRTSDAQDARRQSSRAWHALWNDFSAKLPPEHLKFYQNLKYSTVIGDYVFVHAGLRPNVPMEKQNTHDMLWIRDEFLAAKEDFSHVVVHGHTPTEAPYRDNRRICVDTGAYISGQLTAVRLHQDDISFIST